MQKFRLNDSNKAVLLCALGIDKEGNRKIIGFKFSFWEDYESWDKFLLSLKERGLKSDNLSCIISDDGAGMSSALSHLFLGILHQSCITHKMRNVISKTSYKHKAAVAESLKSIYTSETREEAKKRAQDFAKQWHIKEETAV